MLDQPAWHAPPPAPVLTREQAAAADAIETFITSWRGTTSFVLHGVAGTGKSTVLAHIARNHGNAIICAPTGKAAAVLRRKSGLPASTIHHVLYDLITAPVDPETGKERPVFAPKRKPRVGPGDVVLLDECSMVDDRLAQDILDTGAKIIAVGDPGQLPPVTGRAFFTHPDAMLHEIHRQARESPILRQAHAVRTGHPYHADGDAFRVIPLPSGALRALPRDELLAAEVVLCWRNRTRHALNRTVRHLRGFWQASPQRGELVVCLKNAPEFGVFNGGVYRLLHPLVDGDTQIMLDVDGKPVRIPDVRFEGVKPGKMKNGTLKPGTVITTFEYGYALTVHKSQGSEWDSVLLLDEYEREDRARWLYTAITRAAERIVVVR